MVLKLQALAFREDADYALKMLVDCTTKQETIAAFRKLKAQHSTTRDPTGRMYAQYLELLPTMDEATVMKAKDEFVRTQRNFISTMDTLGDRLGAPAKPKPRRLWLFVLLGLLVVGICVVIAVSAVLVFLAMGSA